MNPDENQLNNQPGDTVPQSDVSTQVPQQQSAADPLGPRPVPPVYDPSVQQEQPAMTVPEPAIAPPVQMPPAQSLQSSSSFPAEQTGQTVSPPVVQDPAPAAAPDQPQQPQQTAYAAPPAQTPVTPQVPQAQPQAQQTSTPQQFSVPPAGNQSTVLPQPNKGFTPKKIVLLAIAAMGGLLAIGVAVFLVLNLFNGSSLKLQEYSNDNFSISYPVAMKIEEDDSGIEMSEAQADDGSRISVVKALLPDISASEAVTLYSEQITKQAEEDENVTLVSSENTTLNGVPGAIIIAKEKTDSGEKDGKIVLITSSNDKLLYLLTFENHPDGIDVIGASDDIVKSFAIKSD